MKTINKYPNRPLRPRSRPVIGIPTIHTAGYREPIVDTEEIEVETVIKSQKKAEDHKSINDLINRVPQLAEIYKDHPDFQDNKTIQLLNK
jgi:hypothetical protein